MSVEWSKLHPQILEAIAGLEKHGFTEPTIRSVYYVLGSLNVIPLTQSGYKRLDQEVVKMRRNGEIPWGFFAVKRGTSVEAGVEVLVPHEYSVTVPYVGPEEWAAFWLDSLRNAADTFQLPRWYRQPNLVEVWVEKDGLLGATSNWLSDLEVTVRAAQGYGAWEFIHESMGKIAEELQAQHKTDVHVLYLGDLDPSGKDIPRFMEKDAIAHFEKKLGVRIHFREIGLSPAQVREHGLPQQPEAAEVMEKIRRDPRLPWYERHYPPDMFVELDAFYSLATDQARTLIRTEVEALFDLEVHSGTRQEESELRDMVGEHVADVVKWRGDESP